MLAFDIIAKVIEDDKKKKQGLALGSAETTKSLDFSRKGNLIPTTLWTSVSIGTDYAVGQQVYRNQSKITPKQVGIESTWGQALLAGIGGELLGGIVSNMLLPASIKNFQVATPSLDTGLAQVVKGAHSLACAYHGYKRHNDSILWALGWGIVGNAGLAISQNFAKPLATRNPIGMNYVREIDHSLGSDAISNPRKRKKKASSKARKKSTRKSSRVSRVNPKKSAKSKVKTTHKKAHTHKTVSRKRKTSHKTHR